MSTADAAAAAPGWGPGAGKAVRESEGRTASPAPPPPRTPADADHRPYRLTDAAAGVSLQPVADATTLALRGAAVAGIARSLTAAGARTGSAGSRPVALAQVLRAWRAHPVGDFVAVPLSARALLDPAVLVTVLTSDLPYGSVLLELAGCGIHAESDDLVAACRRLRAAGARLAVRDIGSDRRCLELARRLAPEVVKLGPATVLALTGSPRCRQVAAATVAVGRRLGATVTAEGVDDRARLGAVRDLGVDHVQGALAVPEQGRGQVRLATAAEGHPRQ